MGGKGQLKRSEVSLSGYVPLTVYGVLGLLEIIFEAHFGDIKSSG